MMSGFNHIHFHILQIIRVQIILVFLVYIITAPQVKYEDVGICSPGSSQPTCHNDTKHDLHPALKPMVLDDGSIFDAYIRPHASTYYRDPDGQLDNSYRDATEIFPNNHMVAARFVNLSPEELLLMWIPADKERGYVHIGRVKAFETKGTSSFDTHQFCFASLSDHENCYKYFEVKSGVARYSYNPYEELDDNGHNIPTWKDLDSEEKEKYNKLVKSDEFAQQYRKFTGRDYLALHPRPRPMHFMWPGEHFDQQHTITTKETHFTSLPPMDQLGKITEQPSARRLSDDAPRILQEYRTPETTMQMNLTVLSVAPRVFEIKNFLSQVEVDHIVQFGQSKNLKESSTAGDLGGLGDVKRTKTRTSINTWMAREDSPVLDSVYRRAADLLNIDEALFRSRADDEWPDHPSKTTIAESLQMVHYGDGQEYTAHHDFGYPRTPNKDQPTRFATLLLYLNEGMVGGETSFPRWINAETRNKLKVTPEIGKAVLFYSFLPDGNPDDLSQHAAEKVMEGEKWLANLWVWDPVYLGGML